MNTLYRYSLSQPENAFKLEIKDYPIKLVGGHLELQEKEGGTFLALNGTLNTYSAHKYLALTYYPSHKYEITTFQSKNLNDNKGTRIKGLNNPDSIPRAWPSFGQPGGSREVILIRDGNDNIDYNDGHDLPDGGEVDEYQNEDSADYNMFFARLISQGVISGIQTVLGIETAEEDYAGLYKQASGVTFSFSNNDKNVSVSVGWQRFCTGIRFKFWYTLWKDIESVRQIYGPLEHTFDLDCCCIHYYHYPPGYPCEEEILHLMEHCIEEKRYPYNELKELVARYVGRLNKVTDGFFRKESKCFDLPSL